MLWTSSSGTASKRNRPFWLPCICSISKGFSRPYERSRLVTLQHPFGSGMLASLLVTISNKLLRYRTVHCSACVGANGMSQDNLSTGLPCSCDPWVRRCAARQQSQSRRLGAYTSVLFCFVIRARGNSNRKVSTFCSSAAAAWAPITHVAGFLWEERSGFMEHACRVGLISGCMGHRVTRRHVAGCDGGR